MLLATASLTAARGAAAQAVDAQQSSDLLIAKCQIRDGSSTPEERKSCWEMAQTLAPTDVRVLEGMRGADNAIKEAEKAKIMQTQASSKSARDSVEFLLARSREDLTRGSPDGADMYVTRVLQIDPNNIEAKTLRNQISEARKWQARKNLLVTLTGVIVVFAVGFIAFAKRIKEWREKSASASGSSGSSKAAAAPSGRVAIRIVDGLGRGRMYTIESDNFRIGAAESDRAEERNDLVLSDSEGLISRFHCALLRRKKKWTIVDSSVNGTWVNDSRLERGEAVAIRDGDDITIAGVTRMTFIGL
jgi:hypothetical protein